MQKNSKTCSLILKHSSANVDGTSLSVGVYSQYHCRHIHTWDRGSCSFHPQSLCSCNQCYEDEEPSCVGKEYPTKGLLTCDYHWMVYRLEWEKRAEDSEDCHSRWTWQRAFKSVWSRFHSTSLVQSKRSAFTEVHIMSMTYFFHNLKFQRLELPKVIIRVYQTNDWPIKFNLVFAEYFLFTSGNCNRYHRRFLFVRKIDSPVSDERYLSATNHLHVCSWTLFNM